MQSGSERLMDSFLPVGPMRSVWRTSKRYERVCAGGGLKPMRPWGKGVLRLG